MSTALTWQTVSISSESTEKLGEQLGQRLKGREVIELVSDLGGGKTTFVRGLARGMGSKTHVSSPTFKISNEYASAKLTLHHFDFYRLPDAGVVAHELHDVLVDPQAAVVVEWGEVVHHALPDERLSIVFKPTGEDSRQVTLTYPESLKYLAERL